MVELALKNQALIGTGSQTRVHPIYKEIRAVIKDIDTLWGRLGVQVQETMLPGERENFTEAMINGDPNYYDNMVNSHGAEQKGVVTNLKDRKKPPSKKEFNRTRRKM